MKKQSVIFLSPRILVLAIILTSAWHLSTGQQQNMADSLVAILKNAKEDTAKVNSLNKLSSLLLKENRDVINGRKHADNALALSEKLNYKQGTASALHNIGLSYEIQDSVDEALTCFKKEISILEGAGAKKETAMTYNYLGEMFFHIHNYTEALKYHSIAQKLCEETGDRSELGRTYLGLGLAHDYLGNFAPALKYNKAALAIAKELGNKQNIASINNNIGNIYHGRGNYAEAINWYLEALRTFEETGNLAGAANACNNVGLIYQELGNYPESLKYFEASLKNRQQCCPDNKNAIAMAYGNISETYRLQGNLAEALELRQRALEMRSASNKRGIASDYLHIGLIYYDMENYPESLKNQLAALKIKEEIKDKPGIAYCKIELGYVNTKLKNYDEARINLEDALSISKETGLIDGIKYCYEGLMKLDSSMGNYRSALENYKLSIVYKDSLINETSNLQIAQAKERYESEKKDREILQLESDRQIGALLLKSNQDSLNIARAENDKMQLENEKIHTLNLYSEQQIKLLENEKSLQYAQIEKNEAVMVAQKSRADKKQEELTVLQKEKEIQEIQLNKQRQTKNFLVAGFILVAVLSFFIYRNYQTRQKLKLQTLRNKIASDLHDDVGSTLSSISMFAQMAQSQSKEVIPALETIGESSRKMLDAMADIVWTINPENDQFEKIVMRMRSFAYELLGARKIDFEFDADDEVTKYNLPMEARKNLYLIFKEATNNLVKYSNATKALFSLKGGKDKLTMMIKDNGIGFDSARESVGNGLKNMKKRALNMGGNLLIDSIPGSGTVIKLELSLS